MSMDAPATLRLLDKADREILALDRSVKGAVYDFLHKFRRNRDLPGLRLKQLSGSELFSARVSQDYRAILAKVTETEWLLLTVAHRSESYDDLEKYAKRFDYGINPLTGAIEFIDIVAVENSINGRRPSTPPAPDRPLFADHSADELRDLGVAESLLPIVAKLTTDDELLGLVEYAPQLTGDILLSLRDGRTAEEVRAQILTPQLPDEPVDPHDFARALTRPATQVTTDDSALDAALDGQFSRWRVFLHPTQRRLVTRAYSGPARVSGGPGTGKTVVALHRARHLAEQLPPGTDRPILLTTYTRNLAADLKSKLLELGGPAVAERVDVVNIDRLARRVVDEAGREERAVIPDSRAIAEWRSLLAETGTTRWDADFLAAEWSQVILGHVLDSFPQYAQVRRAGRTHPLTRADRRDVWQLAERLSKRLDEQSMTTHAATAARAARAEMARADQLGAAEGPSVARGYRYRHVIVDEGQDLHPAHWKMLRAMVAPGPDDLFCVADSHQRIYDNVVTLGSLGIAIRGRSSRLTLNYRTTRQNLTWSLRLLRGETYDDMDGGPEDLAGYRSLLQGVAPHLQGFPTEEAELGGVVAQAAEWISAGTAAEAIAVCLPTKEMVSRVLAALSAAGMGAAEITPDGATRGAGVRVGTMHRFKGMEFQRMVIAGVSDDRIPRPGIDRWRTTDPGRYRQELRRDRSLLFVAATRARDDLAVYWDGAPSRFVSVASS